MNISEAPQLVRPHGIGGTDIAAILGLSPYKTAIEVWTRLVSGDQAEHLDSLHLRFGQHAESFIAKEYERATKLKTHIHAEPVFHKAFDFMFGHIDRFVTQPGVEPIDNTGISTDRILECKSASAFNRSEWGEPGTDQIPASYLMQCAWYLAVTDCQCADVAALIGNNDLRIFHIKRDLEIEVLLLEHAKRFWSEHVVGLTPPKPQNLQDVLRLFPKHADNTYIEASPDVKTIFDQYLEMLHQANTIDSECDRLKREILAYMGQAERLTSQGKTLATWRCAKASTKLDAKALALTHPDIAAQFTCQVQGSRRFLIKEAS